MKNRYFYGMRLRGFSIGCQPMEGFIKREDATTDEFWDVIIYDRPLSDEDIKHYSLTPLYAYEYSNGKEEPTVHTFKTRQETVNDAKDTMQFAYDEYKAMYPDDDIVWTDEDFTGSDISRIFVSPTLSVVKCRIYELATAKIFKTEDDAKMYASKNLGKNDSEVVYVEGKKTFLSSTALPIEDRLRTPVETMVNELLCELGFDESEAEDDAALIGAQICESVIEKLEKYTDVKVVSAYLDY